MSDYLWDKTGEPDEDVKELEELLGNLAYQPRPLELPERLPRHTRMSHSLTWTHVAAIAAALLLMLLAGAALMSMRRQAVTPEQQAIQQPSPQLQTKTPPRHTAEVSQEDEDIAIQPSNDSPEIKQPRNGSRSTVRQVALSRQRRQPSKRRVNEKPASVNQEIALNGVSSQGGELTDEERQAKDQLMLALRFASANLRYVQEQVREVGMTGKPR
ncbi:hypothetical protein BH18ACI2_BH18ACI2_11580 [soil metagenome]